MTPRALDRLVQAALGDLDLRARVRGALLRARLREPVRMVAVGKAAPAMARGALDALGGAVTRALVVTSDDADLGLLAGGPSSLEVLRAAHPLPDARSVAAGRACLALAGAHGGTLLVLVSGGASSLLCAPAAGLTRARKAAVARAMLRSGADVRAINVVRRHLSAIKGGGLARAAHPDRVITLVASDVIGGAPFDVGSGPSVPDPTTAAEARRLLRRYAPAFARVPLVTTLAPGDPLARGISPARVVAAPEELARLVASRLRTVGLRVRVLPPTTAEAEVVAEELVALARRASPGSAWVRAAEPAVHVPRTGGGRGGRSSHVAALVARRLAGAALARPALFAAVATDGVDGASGTSGAIVDGRLASRVGLGALDEALGRFDTGPLLARAGAALPPRKTTTNLADLHVLVVG